MFAWAQSTFDKLSEAVAPPPDDGPGRYAYAVQRGEEDNAMGCIAEFDPALTLVNQGKGIYPLHLACQYSLIRLVKLLFTQPGMMIDQTDSAGNTPLHYAAMSTAPAGLECVQLLIQEYRANVCTKNYQGQTPYDVATMNAIRQYLLPIQLQAETQAALDNGGQGLPPGIDLGGLRIKNSNMPPPPTGFGGPPVASAPAGQLASSYPPVAYGAPPQQPPPGAGQFSGAPPANAGMLPPVGQHAGSPPPVAAASSSSSVPPPAAGQFATGPTVPTTSTGPPPAPHSGTPIAPTAGNEMFDTPTPSKKTTVAAAPASMPADINGKHGYSRVGGSSLAISGIGKYRADGFHSSSSDVGLQKKYGHAAVQRYVPPPPSSGNSIPSAPISGGAGGPNPFAGGVSIGKASRYGAAPPSRSRYVSYGPTASALVPGTTGYSAAYQPQAVPSAPANYATFVPGGAAAAAQQPQQHQTPYQQGAPATPTSQPPPAQQYQYPPPAQSAPQQVASAPASAPPTPSTPYMPPPPYQMQNYGTPSGNQQPGFVSPAAATYGSPTTPGGLETPSAKDMFQSPPPASTGTGGGPSQPTLTQQQPQQPSASDIFSAPSQTTSVPPAQSQQTTASANDVFGAPPQQDSGVPNDVNDTFGRPAVGQDQNAQSASSALVEPQTSTTVATNGVNVNRGIHVASAAYPTQSAQEPSTAPSQQPSAQQMFGATPTANPTYGGSPSGMNILRTQSGCSVQSAEDLFADDAPSNPHQQHQTTSEPGTGEASKQLFANPAPTIAADVFGASPAAGGSSNTPIEAATMPPSGQNASESSNQATTSTGGVGDGAGEEDDGEMEDISLTQSPRIQRPTNTQVPTNPGAVTLNPATGTAAAATTPADNSLFAAIGMPPPPIGRR